MPPETTRLAGWSRLPNEASSSTTNTPVSPISIPSSPNVSPAPSSVSLPASSKAIDPSASHPPGNDTLKAALRKRPLSKVMVNWFSSNAPAWTSSTSTVMVDRVRWPSSTVSPSSPRSTDALNTSVILSSPPTV